jgi:hypothetical protein
MADISGGLDEEVVTIYDNRIRIDPKFTRLWNKLEADDDPEKFVVDRYYTGVIFHPLQITNLFDANIKYLEDGTDAASVAGIVEERGCAPKSFGDFNSWMRGLTYDDMCDRMVRPMFSQDFVGGQTIVLAFIGSVEVGKRLIQKLTIYRATAPETAIAWCVTERISDSIELPRWTNTVAYTSRELGSDIPPTLIMYEHLNRTYPNNITICTRLIKVHTKSDVELFNQSTWYVLQIPMPRISKRSACAGYRYVHMRNDKYNTYLRNINRRLIVRPSFVPTTIFITTRLSFERVLDWFRQNYMQCLIQNMYDTNQTNKHSSCAHFMERLFGYII